MSNHDDFDPLRQHEGIDLQFCIAPEPLSSADLIILPGSKPKKRQDGSGFSARTGLGSADSTAFAIWWQTFGHFGGYQMLGDSISDPTGVEPYADHNRTRRLPGLGYLPLETTLSSEKSAS